MFNAQARFQIPDWSNPLSNQNHAFETSYKPDNINISVKEILLYFCESEFDLAVPPIISIMPDNDENGRIGFPQINISTKSKPLSSMYHSYYDEYTNKNPQTVFSNQQETYGDDSHRQSVEKPAS